jgi:predicted nucleic acid-binding Zn ribbon protein
VPVYTYRCPQGHEWDEIRSIEGSQTSEEPCPTCLEALNPAIDLGLPYNGTPAERGKKVPSQVSVKFVGRGWTPTHFSGRTHK